MRGIHHDAPTVADRPQPRRSRLASSVITLLVAASALAACEGDNLFSGSPAGQLAQGPPRVGSITAPVVISEGDRLDVRVRAIAPAGMLRVDVRFRRAVNDERAFTFEGNRTDSVTVDASIAVPLPALDSIVVVEAYATDRLGRVSDVVSGTIRVQPRTLLTENDAGFLPAAQHASRRRLMPRP